MNLPDFLKSSSYYFHFNSAFFLNCVCKDLFNKRNKINLSLIEVL